MFYNFGALTAETMSDTKRESAAVPQTLIAAVGEEPGIDIRVFRRRWVMLGVFCLLSLLNGVQWVQYAIVSDTVSKFYGVSEQAVDWASMVYMLMYIPFVAPASWTLDNKGLRITMLLAGVLNCLAAWIKVASARPDLFWVTMVGQTLAAVTQAFVLPVPPRLAALWFGAKEVSTACAIGVLGNQVGYAIGFVLPPILISGRGTLDEIGVQLRTVFLGVAVATTLSLLLLALVLQDAPPSPPSQAQAAQARLRGGISASDADLLRSVVRLARTPGFILLTLTYGVSVGVFYAISTVLNRLVKSSFAVTSQDAGNIGLLVVVAGLVGSVLCGWLLDATRKYKQVTLGVYFLSFVGMVAFAASFFSVTIWPVYLTSAVLGFFLTGYLPLGLELAVELTYPEAEGTSAGLLNTSAQVFGIAFTELCGLPLGSGVADAHLWVNGAMAVALLLGTALTAMVPNRLRRLQAQQQQPNGEDKRHSLGHA